MNRILLTALASVALCSLTPLQGLAEAAPLEASTTHDGKVGEKTAAEMATECEGHLERIKNAGAALSADKKAEFDYDLEIAGIEAKTLKDANHKDPKRHAYSCRSHLGEAEKIVRKHENQFAHEKKMEERKAKVEERKAKAEERKAKAAARKAEREAAKAKREATKAEKTAARQDKNHEKEGGLDHGASEGSSQEAPGSDVAQTEEKK